MKGCKAATQNHMKTLAKATMQIKEKSSTHVLLVCIPIFPYDLKGKCIRQ
jgi:hypothetical protein